MPYDIATMFHNIIRTYICITRTIFASGPATAGAYIHNDDNNYRPPAYYIIANDTSVNHVTRLHG